MKREFDTKTEVLNFIADQEKPREWLFYEYHYPLLDIHRWIAVRAPNLMAGRPA